MATYRGEVPSGLAEEAANWHYAVGEQVRVDPVLRFVGETEDEAARRRALVGDRTLTVREVILTEDSRVLYAFDEVGGEHNALGFQDALGHAHDYGVLLAVDGGAWIVPLDARRDMDDPVASGPPKPVDLELDRFGRLNFPYPDRAAFMAVLTSSPMHGEFDMVPLPDGTFRLRASGWSSSTDERTLAVALEAVAAHEDALRYQP